jgi:hypothetical protein
MNNPEKEKLDILIERNAEQQLAKVDWQSLNTSITSRLNTAGTQQSFNWPLLLRIAAIIAVTCVIAAGILIIHNQRANVSARASVELTSGSTRTVVQILDTHSQSEVIFSPPAANSPVAKCEIEIIEPAENTNQNFGGPTWFIICKQETPAVKNGMTEETASMLCLF